MSYISSLHYFTFAVIVFLIFLLFKIQRHKNKNRELINIFLDKIKTLPTPYEDLDLCFATHLPFEDKLFFIYNLNRILPNRTYKVYRWRQNEELCILLAIGTTTGTHLLYVSTNGSQQTIDSFSNTEEGFCLSTNELIDLIKIH